MELTDRRVVVVGASSGIGEAVAVQAATAGAAWWLPRAPGRAARSGRGTVRRRRSRGRVRRPRSRELRRADRAQRRAPRRARRGDLLHGDRSARASRRHRRRVVGRRAHDERGRRVARVPRFGAAPRRDDRHGTCSCRRRRSVAHSLVWARTRRARPALEELARAWRSEHPEIGFSTVAVGNTLGTEVTARWDPKLLGELGAVWAQRGYVDDNGPGAMTVDAAAAAVSERAHRARRASLRVRAPATREHDGAPGRLSERQAS